MMWYVQSDGRLVAATPDRLKAPYGLFRKNLFANLEDAAALRTRAQRAIADARRICHLSQLRRRARR
jgi:hypothetical protein